MSSAHPIKRRNVDPSLSKERERKRSKAGTEEEKPEREQEELVASIRNHQPLHDAVESEEGDNRSNHRRRHDEDEETTYEWARQFLNDLTQIMSVSAAEMHRLMLEHCENVQIPSEALINKWMMTEKRDEKRDCAETADSDDVFVPESVHHSCECSGKHCSSMGDSSFFDSLKSKTGKDDCGVESCSNQNKGSSNECTPSSATVVRKRPRKKRRSSTPWAHRYFNKLFAEGHVHIHSTYQQIYELIDQNRGNEPAPSEGTVQRWLAAKRRELGKIRPDVSKYDWARLYFQELMEDEGHCRATSTIIHSLIQQSCGDRPVPCRSSVIKWMAAERKKQKPRARLEEDYTDGCVATTSISS